MSDIKSKAIQLVAVWTNTIERMFVNGSWQNKTDALGNKVDKSTYFRLIQRASAST